MQEITVPLLVGALTALPFVLGYFVYRFLSRRKLGRVLREPRPWQEATLLRWVERGWLEPELAGSLPEYLSPAVIFFEWGAADPEVVPHWRFREPIRPETPFEALVEDAWQGLPEAERARSRERLAEAVQVAAEWWGGSERGWNRRPLALLESAMPRKQKELPLLPMQDLTAAPLPGPVRIPADAGADGPDLILALAALRRSRPRYLHPLAPKRGSKGSLVEGLSTQVGSDVGRRIGGGLGAALGPIGSMVGQYVGELAGRLGGKALAAQTLPDHITAALKETETALSRLGKVVETDDFARAACRPAEGVLEIGKRLEIGREARSRRFRERIWPTTGLAMIEESLRVALRELQGYRAASDHFIATARKAPEPVAGGMILQNPWLVRDIPGSIERLNGARAALNRAAQIIRRSQGA